MDDNCGSETEYDYIIDAGIREAAQMNALWLNPPHKIEPDRWHPFVINWHPEQFIHIKGADDE